MRILLRPDKKTLFDRFHSNSNAYVGCEEQNKNRISGYTPPTEGWFGFV